VIIVSRRTSLGEHHKVSAIICWKMALVKSPPPPYRRQLQRACGLSSSPLHPERRSKGAIATPLNGLSGPQEYSWRCHTRAPSPGSSGRQRLCTLQYRSASRKSKFTCHVDDRTGVRRIRDRQIRLANTAVAYTHAITLYFQRAIFQPNDAKAKYPARIQKAPIHQIVHATLGAPLQWNRTSNRSRLTSLACSLRPP
jgi:hypothetical protein